MSRLATIEEERTEGGTETEKAKRVAIWNEIKTLVNDNPELLELWRLMMGIKTVDHLMMIKKENFSQPGTDEEMEVVAANKVKDLIHLPKKDVAPPTN